MVATATLSVAHSSHAASTDQCCWCDPDTPSDAQTTVGSDKLTYKLVFSDEFDQTDRNFANGNDAKWTALNVGDTSNKGTAFYLPEQATVQTDADYGVTALRILTENKSVTGDSPTGEKGITMPYRSAMMQSWNKFCFTGGIVEFRARQPRGGGYWPALWAFGNLGRAVYQDSNTGLWPWSYDQCDPSLSLPPTDPPQRISACDDRDYEKEGLLPFQGRGATELDVLEGAVSNEGTHAYAVGSVQLSPGIPPYYRPGWSAFPSKEGPGSWYSGLEFGQRGLANNGWYGPPWGSECLTGCPDALSGGLTEIDDFDTKYWTYRMEWRLGANGGISWFYNDEFVWGMDSKAFGEYSICAGRPGDDPACVRTPARQLPNEPMSLVMNTAIGTWNGGASAIDGKHWPAPFWIDYVRVWQNEENTGCSPPDYPTEKYISKNSNFYGEPVAPLGKDTCPEVYPRSAHDHANEIEARAEKIRAELKKGGATATNIAKARENAAAAQTGWEAAVKAVAGQVLVSPLPPAAVLPSASPVDLVHSAHPAASGVSGAAGIFGAAALAAVGAAALVQRRRQRAYASFPTAQQEALARPYHGL